MSPLVLGALLVAVLLVMAAAMVWQEAVRRPADEPVTYVLEDAVRFIHEGLGPESPLARDDVRRILEWEVIYLQGVSPRHSGPLQAVRVGGSSDAVQFIMTQITRRSGPRYSEEAIAAVLEGEAEYLASIGALGPAVEEAES
ncbi:MAG: hypothetical protein OER12_10750 [Acidimicrobiia bacterium]|nr:hypothetical protein [Acidimicrobiia bacterium]